MSVGRFFSFSFSQKFNRCTSAHFHITAWRLAFVADFGTQNINFKTNDDMKYESLTPEKLGNDANRLLCAGLCLNCKHQSYKSDHTFKKTGICMVKFWMDKRCKLSADKPVLKCKYFEPCT